MLEATFCVQFALLHKLRYVQLWYKFGLLYTRLQSKPCYTSCVLGPLSNIKNRSIDLFANNILVSIIYYIYLSFINSELNIIGFSLQKSTTDETLFRHKRAPNFYHTFESQKYRGFFLGFRKRKGTPTKGNKTNIFKRTAHFLICNVRSTTAVSKLHTRLTEIWEESRTSKQ